MQTYLFSLILYMILTYQYISNKFGAVIFPSPFQTLPSKIDLLIVYTQQWEPDNARYVLRAKEFVKA